MDKEHTVLKERKMKWKKGPRPNKVLMIKHNKDS